MPDYSDILYDIDDLVATIAIDRPKTLNAFNQRTLQELEDAMGRAAADSTVGVLVVTGTGERAFSSGGDVKWEAEGGLDDISYRLADIIADCPKPVIARVNGYAIGGGNHLAYFCDITIAAEHAIFGQNGPRVGSPAASYLVSHLANIVGHKRAREMWLLCRRYTAHEMLEWGLVNAVVPLADLDAEVRRWADDMLGLSPTCLKVIKASMRAHMEPVMGIDMRAMVDRVAPGYYQTGEQQEGAAAFLEKRRPDFSAWR